MSARSEKRGNSSHSEVKSERVNRKRLGQAHTQAGRGGLPHSSLQFRFIADRSLINPICADAALSFVSHKTAAEFSWKRYKPRGGTTCRFGIGHQRNL